MAIHAIMNVGTKTPIRQGNHFRHFSTVHAENGNTFVVVQTDSRSVPMRHLLKQAFPTVADIVFTEEATRHSFLLEELCKEHFDADAIYRSVFDLDLNADYEQYGRSALMYLCHLIYTSGVRNPAKVTKMLEYLATFSEAYPDKQHARLRFTNVKECVNAFGRVTCYGRLSVGKQKTHDIELTVNTYGFIEAIEIL